MGPLPKLKPGLSLSTELLFLRKIPTKKHVIVSLPTKETLAKSYIPLNFIRTAKRLQREIQYSKEAMDNRIVSLVDGSKMILPHTSTYQYPRISTSATDSSSPVITARDNHVARLENALLDKISVISATLLSDPVLALPVWIFNNVKLSNDFKRYTVSWSFSSNELEAIYKAKLSYAMERCTEPLRVELIKAGILKPSQQLIMSFQSTATDYLI